MVTKGLDFNNVNVVGVLNADSILNFPDFRSFEKAFQLITQVKGRAGRSSEKGKVFVQTTQPQHHVLNYISENKIKNFLADTLAERQQFNYPPFTRLFELNIISNPALYCFCFLGFIYLMAAIRHIKFLYRGERLWLRVSSVNDETVVGRVWNHPVNPGLQCWADDTDSDS